MTHPHPTDPARLRAHHDQLLREAQTAESYSNWQYAGRLRREARRIAKLLESSTEKAA